MQCGESVRALLGNFGRLSLSHSCVPARRHTRVAPAPSPFNFSDSLDITVTKALLVIQDRFIGRLIDEYMKAGIPVPRDVANFKNLTVNNRLTDVGKAIPGSKMRLLCHLPVGEIGQLPTRPAGTGPAKKKLRGSF